MPPISDLDTNIPTCNDIANNNNSLSSAWAAHCRKKGAQRQFTERRACENVRSTKEHAEKTKLQMKRSPKSGK